MVWWGRGGAGVQRNCTPPAPPPPPPRGGGTPPGRVWCACPGVWGCPRRGGGGGGGGWGGTPPPPSPPSWEGGVPPRGGTPLRGRAGALGAEKGSGQNLTILAVTPNLGPLRSLGIHPLRVYSSLSQRARVPPLRAVSRSRLLLLLTPLFSLFFGVLS